MTRKFAYLFLNNAKKLVSIRMYISVAIDEVTQNQLLRPFC